VVSWILRSNQLRTPVESSSLAGQQHVVGAANHCYTDLVTYQRGVCEVLEGRNIACHCGVVSPEHLAWLLSKLGGLWE